MSIEVVALMVLSVIALGLIIYLVRVRSVALRLVHMQHQVLSDDDLSVCETQLDSQNKRITWRKYVQAVRKETGGVVRYGHLYQIQQAVDQDKPLGTILTFKPDHEAPYDLREDPGVYIYVKYLRLKQVEGRQVEAFQTLEKGLKLGSVVCQGEYARWALVGEIPGKAPDLAAIHMLEEAIANGFDAIYLAQLLLDGKYVEQDVDRAIEIMNTSVKRGLLTAAVDLGEIYFKGLYGVTPDHQQALKFILLAVPLKTRLKVKIANIFGFSQSKWIENALAVRDRHEAYLKNLSPAEKQRQARELLGKDR